MQHSFLRHNPHPPIVANEILNLEINSQQLTLLVGST